MINVDGSDFVKKGKHSVKVARQYCNSLGKVENCQTGVFDDYSSKHVYGLVNRTFYLPECWHTDDYAKLREQCEIPPGLFPVRWIGCDSFFGRSKEFLSALPEGYYYFADIPESIMVWLKMPTISVKAYSGSGRKLKNPDASTKPIPVSQIAKDKQVPWQKMILGEGAKGPIEQCFEECKTHLRINHYEARSWSAWHQHMLYVFIAHLFVIELRLMFKKHLF